jgi:phosphate transport system substrate-binding protein
MTIFSPGADSGTFDYLTEEVNGTVDAFRTDLATFSEDDNVLVKGVQEDKGAIGYFGYAYYVENADRLRAVPLDRDIDKGGQLIDPSQRNGCVAPARETVVGGTYALSRPLFMYASNEARKKKAQVAAYIEFVLMNPELIEDVGYIRLPENIYEQNLATLNASR